MSASRDKQEPPPPFKAARLATSKAEAELEELTLLEEAELALLPLTKLDTLNMLSPLPRLSVSPFNIPLRAIHQPLLIQEHTRPTRLAATCPAEVEFVLLEVT